MNVYAHAKDAFDERAERLGQLFAVFAAIAVQNAQILAQTQRLAAQFESALTNRAVIGSGRRHPDGPQPGVTPRRGRFQDQIRLLGRQESITRPRRGDRASCTKPSGAHDPRALAFAIARHTIHNIQPDLDVLGGGRPNYSTIPESLIAAGHVVAIEFQTIAAANDYWRYRPTAPTGRYRPLDSPEGERL